jgi:hypothetical protein
MYNKLLYNVRCHYYIQPKCYARLSVTVVSPDDGFGMKAETRSYLNKKVYENSFGDSE